jgi:hypothetical protein
MNLEELAQIGEFLGGLSVLLTMIYLAVQVRGNTRAMRSSSAQQTHDQIVSFYTLMGSDSTVNKILRTGIEDLSALTEDETGQFYALVTASLFMSQNLLYQDKSGSADHDMAHSFLIGVSSNFHQKGFQTYWVSRRYMFTRDTQNWVDEMISNSPPVSGHQMLGMNTSSSEGGA